MTALETSLRRILRDLTSAGVAHALVGGMAVSVRTEPRFTRDADVAVAVENDSEAEALVLRLRGLGYTVSAVVEQEAVARLATVRLAVESGRRVPVVDLLFASSGIESEIVTAAEPIDLLPNLRMPVARIGHLIALKVLSRDDIRRPQDLVDLRALLRVTSSEEQQRARDALALIAARGYSRGRDLVADMNRLTGGA